MKWTINPVTLKVHDSNEHRRIEGRGDEPYLGGIYFRSIFGKPNSTVVKSLDKLHNLGSNIRSGRSVAIPRSAGLKVTDTGNVYDNAITGFTKGVQIMGYHFIAMERDKRGKDQVKSEINKMSRKLKSALKEHIEGNPLGLLNPTQTLEALEREILGRNVRGTFQTGEAIKNGLVKVLKYFGRADDLIGQNRIVLIGLSENILKDKLGRNYQPSTRNNPIAALTPRVFNLDFKGSSAHYSVEVRLGKG